MENQNKVRADLRQLKPFFIVAFVGIIYHLRIRPMAGDDVFFSQATSELGLWNYLIQRYETWTSRFVIEFLLVWIIKYPILWRLIDLALFISFPVLISKIFDGGKLLDWCAAAAVLLYPFHDMGTAGWITTTVNYFWPVWGMFFVGFLLKKMLVHKKINIVEGIAGVLVCVIASSHEQVAVILFVVFILYGIYLICGKSKKMPLVQDSAGSTLTDKKVIHSNNLYLAGMVLVNIITLISILLCPGNAGRNAVSIADLPIFETYGFGDKLYLGLLSIERVFIANCDAVFLTVTLVLAMLVYVKTDDYKKTLISDLIWTDSIAHRLSGFVRSVCYAGADHGVELGCAFYLASDGVSCSHGGDDVICTLDHFRGAAAGVHLCTAYAWMRIRCRYDLRIYGDDLCFR